MKQGGIITPYQSQQGIAVGNAGQAAPYVGSSAFMTPGQSAMPQGLDKLSQGISKLGNAVFEMGIDRQKMQNATDMLADQVAETDSYRNFKTDYEKNHKGADARDAEQATQQYFQDRMDGLQKKWGGNPWLMESVNKMMDPIRAAGLDRAQAYSLKEDELYKQETSKSRFLQVQALASDPSTSDKEADQAFQDYALSLRAQNGGRNMDAQLIDEHKKLAIARVQGRISARQYDDAGKILQAYSGGGTSGGDGQNSFQRNNPGNVKTPQVDFANYETSADGLNAIGGRFIRYQEAPAGTFSSKRFGKGQAQTIRQALHIYAPEGDGKNNPDEYAAFVKQETGLDPDRPMNFRSDPQALAKITRAVVMMENGKKATKNGDIYTQEQYAQGAADAIAGKAPKTRADALSGGTLVADAGTTTTDAGGTSGGAGMNLGISQRAIIPPHEAMALRNQIAAGKADDTALSYISRVQDGEDVEKLQREILALPREERGPVNSLFHGYVRVLHEERRDNYQSGVIDNRAKMGNMELGEAYKFFKALPEGTWTERKIKQQAQADYRVMEKSGGLHGDTDPNAYSALVDAMIYSDEPGGIKTESDLRSHELAVNVSKQDLDKLAKDLKGASTLPPEKDLKTAFRWALGHNPDDPKAKPMTPEENKDFMKFSAWAAQQAENSHRAKEPGYIKDLATQWRMTGQAPTKFGPINYTGDMRFGEGVSNPKWLPNISGEDKNRIDNLFSDNPTIADAWKKRFPQLTDKGVKSAYYKYELEQKRGPLKREVTQ